MASFHCHVVYIFLPGDGKWVVWDVKGTLVEAERCRDSFIATHGCNSLWTRIKYNVEVEVPDPDFLDPRE